MPTFTTNEFGETCIESTRFERLIAPESDFVHVARANEVVLELDFMRVLRACEGFPWGKPTCWVAGGALRDWVVGGQRKDIDVFFTDRERAMDAFKRLLHGPGNLDAKIVESTDAVIRLDTAVGRVDLVLLQYFASARHVVERFDFTACACAVDALGQLTHHVDFEDHAGARKLVVNAMPTPVASFYRVHRLKARGWSIDPEEYTGILRRAVETPESSGWMSGSSPPAKGLPAWADVAWRAIGGTADRTKMVAVMRRAAVDEAWTTELEAVSLLTDAARAAATRDELTGKWLVKEPSREAWAVVRDFICASVDGDR